MSVLESKGPWRRTAAKWQGVLIPVLLVCGAQIAAIVTDLRSDAVASPLEILGAGASLLIDGTLLSATVETLAGAFGGLAIGFGVGVTIGACLGMWRIADRLSFVTLEVFRPIPSIALVPIAMLIFGFGYRMEIAVVAFATIWPVIILTRSAVIGIDPILIEVSRLFGFGLLATIRRFILPAALPRIFVALRLAIGIALIVAVTVEVTANPLGLGSAIMKAEQSLRPAAMLATLVWVGILGWVLNQGLVRFEQRMFGHLNSAGDRR